ncbi:family 20 glycosylhydrolase [Microbulbifer sp. TYP-18]|uniref:family 20 glycosylhydrolase n=1 Tax=Microbulbifer sp. TYP-18 TaxID=3230024 RepID=UPI0034C62D69
MTRTLLVATLVLGIVTACTDSSPPDRSSGVSAPQRIAQNFAVTLEVLTNFQGVDGDLRDDCKRAGGGGAICSTYRISLINNGPAINARERDWSLYFHSIRRTFKLRNRYDFELEHVKGDLHRLTPNSDFTGIGPGATVEFDLLAENWMQFESDFMPRLFVVDAAGEAHIIESTDSDSVAGLVKPVTHNHPDNWKRTAEDKNTLATAASRYAAYSAAGDQERWSTRIIPKPLRTRELGGAVTLTQGVEIVEIKGASLQPGSLAAVQRRLAQLDLAPGGDGAYPVVVSLEKDSLENPVAGAYRLRVGERGAEVIGGDQAGAFYGLQSLLALLDARTRTLPLVEVEDAPRFTHRGLFVDVGRNFHSKGLILKLLDQMAAYKLNRFHFHLSDDEGWRLEIPGLPELTEVGARRCFDLSESRCLLPQLGSGPYSDNNGSGYFSVEDYIEIVRYAAARHIQVIPEFDMPAHARAAVVAMEARYRRLEKSAPQRAAEYRLIDPQDDTRFLSVQFYDDSYINPCMESTYRFVGRVMREVRAMHRAAGQTLSTWHFGGDEAINILAGGAFEEAPGSHPEKGDVPAEFRRQPWSGSPQCQRLIDSGVVASVIELGEYYARRASLLVEDAGIATMGAWNDGVKRIDDVASLATGENYANAWAPLFSGGGDESVRLAEAGFDVVQSHADFLYFDMPYEVDPQESGYYWASRYIDTRKVFSYAPLNTAQLAEISTDRDGGTWAAEAPAAEFAARVRGIQGQLWSEVVRTDQQVEYMVFPRLLALAERAWHRADWELPLMVGQAFSAGTAAVDRDALQADWDQFTAALGHKELFKLDLATIRYRIPVPGAVAGTDRLHTALPYPGLPLEYFDGEHWRPFVDSSAAGAALALRARSADGQRAGRAVELRRH